MTYARKEEEDMGGIPGPSKEQPRDLGKPSGSLASSEKENGLTGFL